MVGLGILLVMISGSLSRSGGASFGSVGFLVILVGMVALMGGRRVRRSAVLWPATLADIDAMTGSQFEDLLAMLFSKSGYRVRRTGGKADLGADLVIEQAGRRTVVQAKRSAAPVGHAAVQQVVAAMAPYGATDAMVVTNATFTSHAILLAQKNAVVLWDRRALEAEVRHHAVDRASGLARMTGLSGGSLLQAELRAAFPMVARAAVVMFSVLDALAASSGRRSHPRKRRHR